MGPFVPQGLLQDPWYQASRVPRMADLEIVGKRALFLQSVHANKRFLRFLVQTTVNVDHLIRLNFPPIKYGGRNYHVNLAGFITKYIAIVAFMINKVAAQRNGRY